MLDKTGSGLQRDRSCKQPRDAGTTGAAGAVAPVAFCLDNFTGALRVQNEGAAERV